MTRAWIVAAAILAVACGRGPTSPSGSPEPAQGPPVRLAVLVVGHISNGPIVGATARIEGTMEETRTDGQGVAAFAVQAGREYVIVVRGVDRIRGRVDGACQWLMSLPE